MMTDQSKEPLRRGSISMYDPARDVYTVSDVEIDRSAERETRQRDQKRDAMAAGDANVEALDTVAEDRLGVKRPIGKSPTPHVFSHTSDLETKSKANPIHRQISKNISSSLQSMDESEHAEEIAQKGMRSPDLSMNHPDDAPADGRSSSPKLDNAHTNDKKRKSPENDTQPQDKQNAPTNQPMSKRKRQEERHQKLRRRGNAPASVFSRRDRSRSPPRRDSYRDSTSPRRSPEYRRRENLPRRSPSPLPRERSPTPEDQARQRKRPGGGARLGLAGRDVLKRRQEERERAQQEEVAQALRDRGVADVVRQHYNMVPERGREWRKTDSKIKGLRSFNNWIKSTLIQKFSPDEEFLSLTSDSKEWAGDSAPPTEHKKLLVVDLGCGKGGDLGKWQLAPQPVELYVGLDPAEISINQARERYNGMKHGRGRNNKRGNPLFHAEFYPKDCFGEWLGDLRIIQQVGIDANVGPGGSIMTSRWSGGGFDVVVSMFTMHYAFESEEKARQMLTNVAGALKKGGRFLGVGPNSDVISAKVAEFHKNRKQNQEATDEGDQNGPEDGEVEDKTLEWGNSIYRVRFPGETPEDGVFRPPFGWKYSYFMEEAVEEIPEYVVPWEAFRALTQEYNLELQFRKPFLEIWEEEKDDPELGPLSERMGVRARGGGPLLVTSEEIEAASFYHAFCFYKV